LPGLAGIGVTTQGRKIPKEIRVNACRKLEVKNGERKGVLCQSRDLGRDKARGPGTKLKRGITVNSRSIRKRCRKGGMKKKTLKQKKKVGHGKSAPLEHNIRRAAEVEQSGQAWHGRLSTATK